ncbi:MAG: TIGR03987 family protein [Flavobacteriaceae bacterium]|nr:TIGR03987 family protein [Flavobacteriaceae bacterium]
MPTIVLYALIYFTLALVFYTIGVWAERLKKQLKAWHLIFFWLGLIADTLGTVYVKKQVGEVIIFNFHTITGILGLLLMLVHTVWATYIVIKNNPKQLTSFHRFSLFVWLLWLIPYFTGFFSGMSR